jgi:hypothetical protein
MNHTPRPAATPGHPFNRNRNWRDAMSTQTTTTKAETFTTWGPVRGCCGHAHRSIAAAVQCKQRDYAGCRRQGGYSDRQVRYSRWGYDYAGQHIPVQLDEQDHYHAQSLEV